MHEVGSDGLRWLPWRWHSTMGVVVAAAAAVAAVVSALHWQVGDEESQLEG